MTETIKDQLARLLGEALIEDGLTQAALAEAMGVSTKHMSQMVNGISGATSTYDFAALILGRRWELKLTPRHDLRSTG